jgi:ATP-dependent Lhr-like helicase
MRFLFAWHGLGLEREGPDFVRVALEQLEGFDSPAAAWEGDILPARVRDYEPSWLDALCLSGRVVWGRFRATARTEAKPSASPIRSTPVIAGQPRTARPVASSGGAFLRFRRVAGGGKGSRSAHIARRVVL